MQYSGAKILGVIADLPYFLPNLKTMAIYLKWNLCQLFSLADQNEPTRMNTWHLLFLSHWTLGVVCDAA